MTKNSGAVKDRKKNRKDVVRYDRQQHQTRLKYAHCQNKQVSRLQKSRRWLITNFRNHVTTNLHQPQPKWDDSDTPPPVYIGGLFGVEINLAIARIPFNVLSQSSRPCLPVWSVYYNICTSLDKT